MRAWNVQLVWRCPQEFDENEKHYYGSLITGNFSYDPAKLPDYVDIDSLPKTETDDQ